MNSSMSLHIYATNISIHQITPVSKVSNHISLYRFDDVQVISDTDWVIHMERRRHTDESARSSFLFVHNNYTLYSTLNYYRQFMPASSIPAPWLVDTLQRSCTCTGRHKVPSLLPEVNVYRTDLLNPSCLIRPLILSYSGLFKQKWILNKYKSL